MTKEQIAELKKKWKEAGGKEVKVEETEDGFDLGEFIESLSYNPSADRKESGE